MAWFRVAYLPAVIEDLQHIDQSLAQRLFEKTKWLASNVDNLRHEPLDRDLVCLSQYAVADWRILYSIDREDDVVDIHRICRRKELYRQGSSRAQRA